VEPRPCRARRLADRLAHAVTDARDSWLDAIFSLCAMTGLALAAAYGRGDRYEVTTGMLAWLMYGIDPGDLNAAHTAAAARHFSRPPWAGPRWSGDKQPEADSQWQPRAARHVRVRVAPPCRALGLLVFRTDSVHLPVPGTPVNASTAMTSCW